MKKFLVISILFLGIGVNAQQDALYSQYMFNPFAINPAYAGSRNAVSGVMLYRSQWVGMSGAPNTMTAAIHSPVKGKNFALGMNIMGEKIGPNTNSEISATYAYHLKLSKGKLSFGLRGGFFGTRMDKDELNYNNTTDPHNTGGQIKAVAPNFDFGMYYYTNRFYIGGSANHLLGQTLNYQSTFNSGAGVAEFKLEQHVMVATGVALEVNPNFVIKPSGMIKYVPGAPINIDLNTSFLFNKVFWLGASYRTSGSFVVITEYNISDYLRIGYSYDFVSGPIKKYNSGSHELFIGMDFSLGRKKVVSPRYL